MDSKNPSLASASSAPRYQLQQPLNRVFRRHSSLALFLHNVRASHQGQQLRLSRFERSFSKLWTNPLVPVGLFVGHLYLIALLLRNPFQKQDLQ